MTFVSPGFAAITLDARGGGVATASRLMWQVLREHWGDRCRLFTLIDRPGQDGAMTSALSARVKFGARLAAHQVMRGSSCVLYSHASLARVQRFVPPRFRAPYAVFLHGIEAWRPVSPAQRQVLEEAALLIANSRYTASRVAEAHPWIGRVIDCGLALPADPSGRTTALVDADGSPRPPNVLIVARMLASERYKGHDDLEAWPAVAARVPSARLIVVGDGDDVARLRGKAEALGVAASVVFTGFVSEDVLSTHYERAAVFAMPSRDEGFGLVYLEAMAHRVPCIGSRQDAARDVIQDDVTGFLVDQADTAGLGDRLVTLLLDDQRRRSMGERGHARLQREFSYERFRDRLLALLDESFGSLAAAGLTTAPSERGIRQST